MRKEQFSTNSDFILAILSLQHEEGYANLLNGQICQNVSNRDNLLPSTQSGGTNIEEKESVEASSKHD